MNSASSNRRGSRDSAGDADGAGAAPAASQPHDSRRASEVGDVDASGRGATASTHDVAAPGMSVDEGVVPVVGVAAANARDGGGADGVEGAEVMRDVQGVGGDVRVAAAAGVAGAGALDGARGIPREGGLPMARIFRFVGRIFFSFSFFMKRPRTTHSTIDIINGCCVSQLCYCCKIAREGALLCLAVLY